MTRRAALALLASLALSAPAAAQEATAEQTPEATAKDTPEALTRGLVAAGPATAPGAQLYDHRVALVVGISHYRDPTLDLDSPVRDAQAVATQLEQRFGFDQVTVLLDEQASRDGVLGALADLTELAPDDALLIYWAGHGTTATTADGQQLGYLLPWDGSTDPRQRLVSNLSMEEIRSLVGHAVPARHKLMVVDACYSGILTLRDTVSLPPQDAAWLREAASQPVFQIITAGQADQAVLDQGPDGHSVFTSHLLDLLSDTQDYLTGSELGVRLQRRVRADAYAHGSHLQTPAYGRISGTGDFVLIPRSTEALVTRGALPAGDPPRSPSRRLSVGAAGSLILGATGLGVAAATHSAYVSAPLADGDQPGLYAANRAATITGWSAVGLSAALATAAVVRWDW